ncbi:MAG: response regulator [Alphaproteobacteria bacterium]
MARPARDSNDRDKQKVSRERFGNVRVLVADRDIRTATLVQRVLFSFGFAKIDVTNSGDVALEKLRTEPYDLIVTEWQIQPMTGIDLVRAIRRAKADERLRRDIPIIMLTARGDKETVTAARDAGITEFLVKPFSAATISNRLVQVIDNPRIFVEAGEYSGPCRRRRADPPPGMQERRGKRAGSATISPPNEAIRDRLSVPAAELLTEGTVTRAQDALLAAEGDFLAWAKDDIARLEARLPRARRASLRRGPRKRRCSKPATTSSRRRASSATRWAPRSPACSSTT